jgi:hypothetical protein
VLALAISAAVYFVVVPRHRHSQAVEHIQKLGGSIENGSTDYNTYADVVLRDIPLTRDDLEIIVHFRRMATLDVTGTGITREDYKWLTTTISPDPYARGATRFSADDAVMSQDP